MFTAATGGFNLDIPYETSKKVEHLKTVYGWKQIITEPKRITPYYKTLIDLMFVSCENILRISDVLDHICSDHCPIFDFNVNM